MTATSVETVKNSKIKNMTNEKKYEGDCEGCGKCCMMGGPNGDQPCKYLVRVEENGQ